MSTSPSSSDLHPAAVSDVTLITRREAIRRASLFLGVALTPSLLTGVLQAQTLPAAGARPAYLTTAQLSTVGAVAERILPRTDTPGALDVGVPAFVDLMVGKYLTADERDSFTAGLADLESASTKQHQKSFSALTVEQQDALLTEIATGAPVPAKAFFRQLKELTITGYFTSETVGKKVLHYDPIPGPYKGCIPLAEVGNVSWTK